MSNATEYKNKYINSHYDRINLTVPKGTKTIIAQRAKELGLSTNSYLHALVRQDLENHQNKEASHTGSEKEMAVFLL